MATCFENLIKHIMLAQQCLNDLKYGKKPYDKNVL